MNLSRLFIMRPVMTTLATCALVLSGLLAYWELPVSDLPNVEYPTIRVMASLTGASPQVVAETIATPLEKEFTTIPGVSSVYSQSMTGSTSIVLTFKPGKAMDAAAQDVEAALSRAVGSLPGNMQHRPTYFKDNPSQMPVMYLALTSKTLSMADLYEYGESVIAKRFTMVEGVARAQTYGPQRQIEISMDPDKMRLKQISVGELRTVLLQANPRLPAGQLTGDTQSLAILTDTRLRTVEDYASLIIKNTPAGFVRLGEVAEVAEGPAPEDAYFRYIKGDIDQPTVIVAVQRLPGANAVEVTQAIRDLLPRLEEELPRSISVIPIFDTSVSIKESIEDVQITLVIALVLVVMTLFFYFGRARDTLIPALVLPLSVIATFGVMYVLGFSINNLSLLALTLALGFVVDDAIVVIENIIRGIEAGERPMQAAIKGSKQISFTVLSMTLSLTASFIPLLFMGGIVGLVLREFAVTLAIAVLVSGVLSLTLTPMLASRLLSGAHSQEQSNVGRSFNAFTLRVYDRLLGGVLRFSKTTVLCGFLIVGGVVWLFQSLPMEFLPHNTIPNAFIGVHGGQGVSPRELIKYRKAADKIIKEDPGVIEFISWSHQGSAPSFVTLDPNDAEVTDRLQKLMMDIPGATAFVHHMPLLSINIGSGIGGRTQYQLRCADYDELVKVTQALTDKVRDLPGFINVTNDLQINRPQLNIEMKRERAALLGISAEDIEMTLLNAYSKSSVTTLETTKGKMDIILGVRESAQRDAHALEALTIVSPRTGERVPLSTVASWTEMIGPNAVQHYNQFPAASIAFSTVPEITLPMAIEKVNELAADTLPPTVTGRFEGEAKAFGETFGKIGFLVLITFVTAYLILGILYESFIHPITILSTLPPAAIGGLIALKICGLPLSLFSLIGLILLVGIVKKNGIMMVDQAMELRREQGLSAKDAIREACNVRFRPMMMTTFAAIMGALPIALNFGMSGGLRSPLGYVIVGGLLISQFITLFVTPAVYVTLDRLTSRGKAEKPMLATAEAEALLHNL